MRRRNRRWFGIAMLLAAAAAMMAVSGCVSSGRASASKPQTSAPEGMVLIPGGAFIMGCVPKGDCTSDELPRHQVVISAFNMDIHEVTVAEYDECVKAGACMYPRVSDDPYFEPYYNWDKPDRQSHPVNGVHWNDADIYCRWKGKRLPTEAEFEYALRGGKEGTKYPWGDADMPPPGYGNYADKSAERHFPSWGIINGYDDGYVGTSPACSFAKNAYGLCDISGNVWEWCYDWWSTDYYAVSPSNDPKGPSSGSDGSDRVLRGGCWRTDVWSARTSSRFDMNPSFTDDAYGFRCAKDVD